MNVKFFMSEDVETLPQDILDARFGCRKEETNKEEGEVDNDPRMAVRALD